MAVIALASAASCGVTSSALALTLSSPRPSLLAECDPKGGTLRAGFLQGQITAGIGLYHLAAAERVSSEAMASAFASHLWPLDEPGHRKLLAGLTDPAQAAALGRTWSALSDVLHVLAQEAGHDVYVDAGRVSFTSGLLHQTLTPVALIHQADLVVLVVRNTEPSLSLTRHVIDPLRAELDEHGAGSAALGLLVIERETSRGSRGYTTHQIADALKTPVLAALPWDAPVADYFTEGGTPPRGYGRCDLLRYARTAAEHLAVVAQRRRVQQQFPAPAVHGQLAGLLQRLGPQRGAARG
ncbi:hypothetical protein OHO83_09125 [Streptomyces sp. NBC_00569]|uniref:hypothetical protein n=1 Tax=Streptomyces sp. NBC_00569 TaxID=2975780 RepID=UPI002E820907|nr:hypothetical protein [Streptomyces sp. NBC_00569]WUB92461.1 hypothetical protein OHO83_09125 [Streptomyces sp. NBC_00569]